MPPASARLPPKPTAAIAAAAVLGAEGVAINRSSRFREPSGSVLPARDVKTQSTDGPELEAENFGPPEWRTVLNRRADLGYPDFYPSRPGYNQPEDVLTEESVKDGYKAKAFVAPQASWRPFFFSYAAESFSMHGPIHSHLLNGCLGMLNKLGQEVMQKREEGMPSFGERAFRIPARVTYNDTKRFQFLADLGRPEVPLHRLMRNPVPHGFKGVELLDIMYAPPVGAPGSNMGHNRTPSGGVRTSGDPIPANRATWFIRVLGANEITAHRSRAQPALVPMSAPSPAVATPSSTNTAPAVPAFPVTSNEWWTIEFTSTVTMWLRGQLNQLSLPNISRGAVKPLIPPPKVTPSVLVDEGGRKRWKAKWEYSASLLRELHTKRLVSFRILCGWMTDYLDSCNLAQLGFITQLIGDYIHEIVQHVSISRVCLRHLCSKLETIRQSPAAASLEKIELLVSGLIQTLFDLNPEIALSPRSWERQGHTLRQCICHSPSQPDSSNRAEFSSMRLRQLEYRSKALLFCPTIGESSSTPRRQQNEEIRILDSISAETDMSEICRLFFDGAASPSPSNPDMVRVEEKIVILLNWANGLFQLGSHRPYAVYTLLKLWNKQHVDRDENAGHRATIDLFAILYRWLDASSAARAPENVLAIGITYGELTRQGLFSYGQYLQTLVVQGLTARSQTDGLPLSHHLPILRALPMFLVAKDLLQQRRIALSGDNLMTRRNDAIEEEEALSAYQEEIKEYIPEVFGMRCYGRSASFREAPRHHMRSANGLTRHLFLQARFWSYPLMVAHLKRHGQQPAMDASTFARCLNIFRIAMGYSTMADFLIQALQDNHDEEILAIIIDALHRDADTWTALDRWGAIADALMNRHHTKEKKGQHHVALTDLLLRLADQVRLSEDDEEEVREELIVYKNRLEAATVRLVDVKDNMVSWQQTMATGDEQFAASLAAKLFAWHGPFNNWSASWWQSIVEAIRSSPGESSQRQAILKVVLAHVRKVDQEAEHELRTVVNSWLASLDSRLDVLDGPNASMLCETLLTLAAERRASSMILFDKLVFPMWKQAINGIIATRGYLTGTNFYGVEATVTLAQQLLLSTPPHISLPPISLRQTFALQTSRTEILQHLNVPRLIRILPLLVVIQAAKGVPERLRQQIDLLVSGLAEIPEFKAAAYRHISLLKDAFLSNEWSRAGLEIDVETNLVNALRLIMSQGSSSSSLSNQGFLTLGPVSQFGAWRWTSVVLEMRVEFKRLGLRIVQNDNKAEAKRLLTQLVHATLDRVTSDDDVDLLNEAFKGTESAVTAEILCVGLERLISMLSIVLSAEQQETVADVGQSIEILLRILDVSARDRESPQGDVSVLSARHRLIDLISVALQAIERQLGPDNDLILPDGLSPPRAGDMFHIALKLLSFALGVRVSETSSPLTPQPNFSKLITSYLRVLVILPEQVLLERPDYLRDMLVYITDSASIQARATLQTALLAESASLAVQEAIRRIPGLAASLPCPSPLRRTVALYDANDISGNVLHHLDDRPWEMLEQVAPCLPLPSHEDRFLAGGTFKDTACIPMSLFSPRIKHESIGDAVKLSGTLEEGKEGELEGSREKFASERDLGNGIAGEPLAAKQVATMLYAGPKDAAAEQVYTTLQSPRLPLGALGSPTTSVSAVSISTRPRRMSTRLTTAGTVSRPGSSHRDPITVDEDDEEEDELDSDAEEVEEPLAKRSRTGSKSTRSTTSGKAPARKTVSGKNVARKVTAGKTTRKTTGGKAPRGAPGRRNSRAGP